MKHEFTQYRYSYDIPPIQCNASYLNPVRNYEYLVSLKLKYSAHNAFVFGELQMTFSEPQRKQGHK